MEGDEDGIDQSQGRSRPREGKDRENLLNYWSSGQERNGFVNMEEAYELHRLEKFWQFYLQKPRAWRGFPFLASKLKPTSQRMCGIIIKLASRRSEVMIEGARSVWWTWKKTGPFCPSKYFSYPVLGARDIFIFAMGLYIWTWLVSRGITCNPNYIFHRLAKCSMQVRLG